MRSRDLEFMRSRGQEIYTDTNSPFCDADIYAHIHVDYMVRGLTTLVASTHCLFDLKFLRILMNILLNTVWGLLPG